MNIVFRIFWCFPSACKQRDIERNKKKNVQIFSKKKNNIQIRSNEMKTLNINCICEARENKKRTFKLQKPEKKIWRPKIKLIEMNEKKTILHWTIKSDIKILWFILCTFVFFVDWLLERFFFCCRLDNAPLVGLRTMKLHRRLPLNGISQFNSKAN